VLTRNSWPPASSRRSTYPNPNRRAGR
jgi:hypothetical protein